MKCVICGDPCYEHKSMSIRINSFVKWNSNIYCLKHFNEFNSKVEEHYNSLLQKFHNDILTNFHYEKFNCKGCSMFKACNIVFDENNAPYFKCQECHKVIRPNTECEYKGYRKD